MEYYEILGLEKEASQADIKKAYRKMAIKYHPDKNPDNPAAEEKFKEAAEAYETLSDEGKRQQYDQFGKGGPSQGFGGGGFNVRDIFSQFGDIFGGGGGFGGGSQVRQRKGKDLRVCIKMNLKEIIEGSVKKLKYTRDVECNTCDGQGGDDVDTCSQCKGARTVTYTQQTSFGVIQQSSICPKCNGEGNQVKNTCGSCHGSGTEKLTETIDIDVPKGATDGTYLKKPMGGHYAKNGTAGDLHIVIEEATDINYKRQGLDLIHTGSISVIDAILGTQKEIILPDGTKTMYRITSGTEHGTNIRIKGKGIPDAQGYYQPGDVVIQVGIRIPKTISREERELMEKLKNSKNFN